MLPAGIISSGGMFVAALAESSSVGAATETAGVGGAGKVGNNDGCAAGAFVLRMRRGVWRTAGSSCAHRSRPVKNKIRKSVVVFIWQFWWRTGNCFNQRVGRH